ncbi:MAG TPA: hypothetical protein VIC05_11895 [Solirubrobacteraceae bacterium]|jgi:hypothetical protein
MRTPLHKLILLLSALGVCLALGACGDSHTKVTGGTYAGESGANAPYLDVGPLVYEVQLSRQLNPNNAEDSVYLEGLSPTQRALGAGEEWFAVFMQIYNHSGRTEPVSRSLTISDTQGDVYFPVVPGASNPFAYRGGQLAAKSRLPELNTTAADGPTQGTLLLYKIKITSLDNRPLLLKIVDPSDSSRTATAELDV